MSMVYILQSLKIRVQNSEFSVEEISRWDISSLRLVLSFSGSSYGTME